MPEEPRADKEEAEIEGEGAMVVMKTFEEEGVQAQILDLDLA